MPLNIIGKQKSAKQVITNAISPKNLKPLSQKSQSSLKGEQKVEERRFDKTPTPRELQKKPITVPETIGTKRSQGSRDHFQSVIVQGPVSVKAMAHDLSSDDDDKMSPIMSDQEFSIDVVNYEEMLMNGQSAARKLESCNFSPRAQLVDRQIKTPQMMMSNTNQINSRRMLPSNMTRNRLPVKEGRHKSKVISINLK